MLICLNVENGHVEIVLKDRVKLKRQCSFLSQISFLFHRIKFFSQINKNMVYFKFKLKRMKTEKLPDLNHALTAKSDKKTSSGSPRKHETTRFLNFIYSPL